ncbi:MAG: hypothetical protein KDC38_03055, partial [Planctomycetes bacterium]|nr:hypothetical protein [Planctomycetota bacterium]
LAPPVPTVQIKKNRTHRLIVQISRAMLEDLHRPPNAWRVRAIIETLEGHTWLWHLLLGNRWGEALAAEPFHWSSLSQFAAERYCEVATDTLIAIHLFRRRTGREPASLEELVPTELPAVPIDPLTGEPLRYSEERGTIESVSSISVGSRGVTCLWRGDEVIPVIRP